MTINFLLLLNSIISQELLVQNISIHDFYSELALNTYFDILGASQVATAYISIGTNLLVDDKNVSDISAIQDFNALPSLLCFGNKPEALPVTQYTKVIELTCDRNQRSTSRVTQNTALNKLNIP